MIPVIIELSGIDPDKKVNEISKEERNRLLMLLRSCLSLLMVQEDIMKLLSQRAA